MRHIKKFKLLLTILISGVWFCNNANAQAVYGDVYILNGKYAAGYTEIPQSIVSLSATPGGATFQWEKSIEPTAGFANISGATSATLVFTAAISQTTFYRRKITVSGNSVYSNIIKIEVVTVDWENINYVAEHDILIRSEEPNRRAISTLTIGNKLQKTIYFDGIGRKIQALEKGATTEPDYFNDIVTFKQYDAIGREPKDYLPYTTTNVRGKYKSNASTEQALYYSTNYNETSPFISSTFDNSPINRITNSKASGTSWAAGTGTSQAMELNDLTDAVQNFSIGYSTGDIPVSSGAYNANTLNKITTTDENGNLSIQYINDLDQTILTKVQIDVAPAAGHTGWICTYSVYDDFGLLRYRIQPEAVKWLEANSWSFTASGGTTVLEEQCFRYEYDIKGRCILKKAPGSKELLMLYDARDRVVFMQDGNQRQKTPPEWTANLYDEQDRPILLTIYKTSKTVSQLQTDIAAAAVSNSITISSEGVIISAHLSPLGSSDLNNSAVTTILKYNFYDNYSYAGVKAFSTSFDNTLAYPSSAGDPIASSLRTLSMHTGTKVRVLGTNTFLTNTVYYEERGRVIQTNYDNIKSGTDINTFQYKANADALLSSNLKHSATGTAYTSYSIVTKNILDKILRIKSVQKKFGTNPFKSVCEYTPDDLGNLKKKRLDPGYTGTGKTEIETLLYSYNIHEQITGINKDYALKSAGYNKWNNFFGLYIGYDNKDNVFAAAQLDGHMTGSVWSTQGDDVQRKNEFSYDRNGRLENALFTERAKLTDSWNSTKMDFSSTGTSGKITYDLNGNLLNMIQKGVLPGNATPLNIDNLAYQYYTSSNRLKQVIDNGTAGTNNGKLGDFTDGTNGASTDYQYDDDGNIITDYNKDIKSLGGITGASGIKYNFLDKPEEINVAGKGVIKFIYDADGHKLQKTFKSDGSSTITTTSYINDFVYIGDDLQYINFEEGRVRVMQTVSLNNGFDMLSMDGNIDLLGSKRGAYDFFIRDYLGNIRMILTEETHSGSNSCTMETARAANEEPLFGKVDASGVPASDNEVKARFAVSSIPDQSIGNGWTNPDIGSQVVRIGSNAGSKLGPNTLFKVMAGDEISATSVYYYQNAVTNTSGPNSLLTTLLSSLTQAISGGAVTNSLTKGAASNITTQLGSNIPFSDITSPDAGSSTGTNPKAYLTVLFFDERFNFVEEGSDHQRVVTEGNGAAPLALTGIKAPKNGYVYIYLSNESAEHVYFDNLQVSQVHKQLVEEDHYYAYGLKIAGISSVKLGDTGEGHLKNNNLYNDKELIIDADLGWYDYGFRNFDAQTGRFMQLDPLTDDYPELTNYQYASCDPIRNIDIDGLEGKAVDVAGKSVVKITAGTAVVATTDAFGTLATRTAEAVAKQALKKTGEKILLKAFEKPGWSLLTKIGVRVGGTLVLVLLPLDAGTGSDHARRDLIEQPTAFPEPSVKGQPDPYPDGIPKDEPGPGNRKKNPNKHIVYALYGNVLGQNPNIKVLLKFGISDYRRYGHKRPRSQGARFVNARLATDHPYKGKIYNVSYEVEYVNNRWTALAEELRLVTEYFLEHYMPPPIQRSPAPGIFDPSGMGGEH